jgi:HNH endonuclease
VPSGEEIDHANGDGLDNRRANLRPATHGQNQQNSRKARTYGGLPPTSRYKGVSRFSARWKAEIRSPLGYFYLGLFDKEEDAARAYDAKAEQIYGAFARLNFTRED